MSFQYRHRLAGHTSTGESELFVTPSTVRRSFAQRIAFTFVLWRQRTEMRRALAQMDARSLRDAGISPAAAAYESGKAFWERPGCLR